MDDYLMHYGKGHDDNPPGRGSGRLPWGSGDRPLQHAWDFCSRVDKLNGQGIPEKEIAKMMGMYDLDKRGNIVYDENGEPIGNINRLRAHYQNNNYKTRTAWYNACIDMSNTINPETGEMYTPTEIGRYFGINEGSVRNYLRNSGAQSNAAKTARIMDQLKERCEQGIAVAIGPGTELFTGGSRDRLKKALILLRDEGYGIGDIYEPQPTSSRRQLTDIQVIYRPGVTYDEVYKNRDQIISIEGPNSDRAATLKGMQYPTEVDLSRVKVRFGNEGGTDRDGLIELRAVRDENGNLVAASPDLSLGNAKYAQVRIAVDADSEGLGKRYLKGMAVYSEDLPEGTDILVHSNKNNLDKALKKMEQLKDGSINRENPFGTTVFQSDYEPGKLSAINIVGDVNGKDKHIEGAWNEWSRNLPSQLLAKQPEALIKQQLNIKVKEKEAEYDEIMRVNNPLVKQRLLKDFADGCDAASGELKAAPIAGQRTQVLLPVPSLKDNEIYAPQFENGQTVALVRFPHLGPPEIPILKVNNGNQEARSFMKDAKDAVGINPTTASRLSGADFDGDTAIVIPMTRKNSQGEFDRAVNIKGIGNGSNYLEDMIGFDPKDRYPAVPGMTPMTKKQRNTEMGKITNLIFDMQMRGCEDPHELARADMFSMVVIDAYKHKLNWKQAEKDYNIKELRNKYQDGGGASTFMTQAGAEIDVPLRQIWNPSRKSINPETGEKIYKEDPKAHYNKTAPVKVKAPEGYTWTDKNGKEHKSKYVKDENGKDVYETYVDKNGRVKEVRVETGQIGTRTQKVSRISTKKDAYELLSENPSNVELMYANYSNKMKAMANTARKEWLAQPTMKKNSEAVKEYADEVASLNVKLNNAKKNSVRERQAIILANQIINARKSEDSSLDDDDLKKLRGFAMNYARQATGAHKDRVTFTDREWEAIVKGAVSPTIFDQLLDNADKSSYMQYALPESSRVSQATANYVNALLDAGWSRTEIKNAGYASDATIDKVLAGQVE